MFELLGGALRTFFAFIDGLIYWLLSAVYGLLIDISKINIFDMSSNGGENLIQEISSNIYVLIGVFMLFKLAWSLLQYIIDPDKMMDKSKGGAKIISELIITLVLIIAMPLIFREMYNLQKMVLEDDIIGIIVTGQTQNGTNGSDKYIEAGGNRMATSLLVSLTPIADGVCKDSEKMPDCLKRLVSSGDSTLTDSDKYILENSSYYKYYVNDGSGYDVDSNGEQNVINPTSLIDGDLLNIKLSNNKYLLDYKWLLTSLVGAAMAWILILYCVDVAKRAITLAFLQIIAPIPIMSRLGGSKGNSFGKWVQRTTSTFLSLFVKLATFYLAVRIVTYIIDNMGAIFGGNLLVFVFLCIGTFYFLKDIDKFISSLFDGIGGDGFNPFKRTKSFLNKTRGAAGGLSGGIAGAASRFSAKYDAASTNNKRNPFLRALGSGVVGAVGGAIRGAKTAYGSKDGFVNGIGSAVNAVNEASNKAFSTYGQSFFKKLGIKDNYAEEVRKQNETYRKFSGFKYDENGNVLIGEDGKPIVDVEAGGSIAVKQAKRDGFAEASDYEGLIKHADMRTAVANMVNAKNRRNVLQSEYETLHNKMQNHEKIELEDGKKVEVTAEMVDKARIAAAKADSVYSNAKSEYDNYAKVYELDAKAYANYTAGEDRTKYTNFDGTSYKVQAAENSQKARGGRAIPEDYEELIKDANMRNAIATMVNAEKSKNEKESKFNILRDKYKTGETITKEDGSKVKVTAELVEKARTEFNDATATYDRAKSDYDNYAKENEIDAKVYEDYLAGKNRAEQVTIEEVEVPKQKAPSYKQQYGTFDREGNVHNFDTQTERDEYDARNYYRTPEEHERIRKEAINRILSNNNLTREQKIEGLNRIKEERDNINRVFERDGWVKDSDGNWNRKIGSLPPKGGTTGSDNQNN